MKFLVAATLSLFVSSLSSAQYRPRPVVDKPTIQQVNGFNANVPMKHGSCGLDCGTHVLAVQNGNLNIRFKAGMICSEHKKVKHLSVRPQGQNSKTLSQNSLTSSVSHTIYSRRGLKLDTRSYLKSLKTCV